MADTAIVVSLWLHVLAAVIWIGGIATILMVVLPSGRKITADGIPALMGEVSKRFTPIANVSIGLLLLTGLVLVFARQTPGPGANETWPWTLGLKIPLAALMFLIHFYRNLFLVPKIGRTTSETAKASFRKLSLTLVKINFGIALAVLLASSIVAVL